MLKKIVCSILGVLLLCGCIIAGAYKAPDMIKVGLFFGNEAKESFSVRASDGFVIGYVGDREFFEQTKTEAKELLIEKGGGAYLKTEDEYETFEEAKNKIDELGKDAWVGYIDGNYYVLFGLYSSDEEAKEKATELFDDDTKLLPVSLDKKTVMVSGDDFSFVFRNEEEVFALGSAEGKTVFTASGEYYGYILAERRYSENIGVINLVDTDDYVACVVGSEMYSTWPIEALKAQAVIARTYAMTSTSYKNYGIDVTDDTRSQAYYGLSRETESTRRAADETSGQVLLYKDAPAQTFFYASSGGKTADVYSAWGGGAGLDYLKSVEDTYEDSENVAVWSVTFTAAEIDTKLKNAGVDIGSVTDIKVEKRGETDERVHKLCFYGTKGTHTLTFEKCRTFLGLKSQYYYIREQIVPKKISVLSSRSTGVTTLGSMKVLGSKTQLSPIDSVSVLGAKTTVRIKNEEASVKTSFTFDGRGHGHGVGLSQYGAKGMASAGFSYDEILKHYYTGTTLSK